MLTASVVKFDKKNQRCYTIGARENRCRGYYAEAEENTVSETQVDAF